MRAKAFFKRKKLIIVGLLVLFIISFVTPMIAAAINSGNIDMVGTKAALGSPLLNANFEVSQWNKWELIAFGVFLSNFAYPLVDNYVTAFTNSNEGSKGAGFKALAFGSGNDPSNNQVLKEILNYAVMKQKSNLQRIQANMTLTLFGYDEIGTLPPVDATMKDLFPQNLSEEDLDISTILQILKKEISIDQPIFLSRNIINITGDNIDGLNNIKGPALTAMPRLTIKTRDNQNIVVYDYTDGWDIQMLNAWLSRVSTGELASIAEKNFETLLNANAPIYLDTYGNIVALYQDIAYIIIPSAANQHITTLPQYNMLTSVMFNGSYLETSKETIINKAQAASTWVSGYRGGTSPLGNESTEKSITPGSTVVLYDTDTLLYQRIMDLAKSGQLEINFPEAEKVLNQRIMDLAKSGQLEINFPEDEKVLKSVISFLTAKGSVNINNIQWGNIINNVMESDINSYANPSGFKVEVVGAKNLPNSPRAFQTIATICESLSSIRPTNPKVPVLNYVIAKGAKRFIFQEPIVTSVNIGNDANGMDTVYRQYIDFLYQNIYKNNGEYGSIKITPEEYKSNLKSITTVSDTAKMLYTSKNATEEWLKTDPISPFLQQFIKDNKRTLFKYDRESAASETYSLGGLKNSDIKLNNNKAIEFKEGDLKESISRIIKVYTYSDTMKKVSNVLAVREGTDFGLWSPYIYLTYLDWYGITGTQGSKFDVRIFEETSDILKFDIESVSDGQFLTKEQKKDNIIEYTHMILHPSEGRSYRSQLVMDGITDWIYRTYQNIVYGKAIESYASNNQSLANRNAAGFLHIDSYSDNFMTGWFVREYSKYIVIILGIATLAIIIVGIITQKKFVWYITSLLLLINIVILTPSIGEITPYIVNNTVQNMFSDKMTYWAISEGVTNATLEKEIHEEDKYYNSMDSQEGDIVADLARMLNIVYLDRAMMLKIDISKKITETELNNFSEIQKIQSARWLLPILMRQFTANDGSANYVYIPLGDVYDNLSNMYWCYVPSDMLNTETVNSGKGMPNQGEFYNLSTLDKKRLYSGYEDTSMSAALQAKYYDQVVLKSVKGKYNNIPGWQSWSRQREDVKNPHTGFYLLRGLEIPSYGKYEEGTWESYVDKYKDSIKDSLKLKTDAIELTADRYNIRDMSTISSDFGFLWTTENPLHYFYQVIKDTLKTDTKTSVLAGEIQGIYGKSEVFGLDVRQTFMHYQDTGKIRDFLDLEEMFTNTIPYIYQVQILAGGFNGKSGALEDEKISSYALYKDNYKSWLYRSNWVTKLMEAPLLTNQQVAVDYEGNKYTVINPMLPSCYIDASKGKRPMIFSEAQMVALGLNESCLTNVELKILKVNKAVERKWTLLLNYVNIPGMTPEVLIRQMAVDALIEFNKEFSPDNLINPSLAMYPTSIDLRSISFDSVMKMLMINTTKDSRYIYGDTMKITIENSDIISATLLLIAAFLCAYIVPLIRNILLGMLFFLGFVAVLSNILSGGKAKLKITSAYAISNIIFLLMTLAYYTAFDVMIDRTYTDNVLSVNNIIVNVGNPVWVFILILIISCMYIYGSYKMINFSFKNYRDLGFEVYATWAGMLANKISNGVKDMGGRISSAMTGSPVAQEGRGNSKRSNITNNNSETGSNKDISTTNINVTNKEIKNNTTQNDMLKGASGYFVDNTQENNGTNKNKLDAEIQKGKKM